VAGIQGDARFTVLKYLPPGGRISRDTDVAFADLAGDGREEAIVFYTLVKGTTKEANVIVLKPEGSEYVQLWQNVYEDSSGFGEPTGVYNLLGGSTPQIVAYRTIGAACPGVLDIYAYKEGEISAITGPWASNGQCQSSVEIEDLDRDGVSEIIVSKAVYGAATPDIYSWNGTRYAIGDRKFSQYYDEGLANVVGSLHSRQSLPASARVGWATQAVEMYIRQRRYAEAARVCQRALVIIDDPKLTESNTVLVGDEEREIRDRVLAWFEIEKMDGKAAIYKLLGKTYKAAGNVVASNQNYERAQVLESEAKTAMTKVPN